MGQSCSIPSQMQNICCKMVSCEGNSQSTNSNPNGEGYFSERRRRIKDSNGSHLTSSERGSPMRNEAVETDHFQQSNEAAAGSFFHQSGISSSKGIGRKFDKEQFNKTNHDKRYNVKPSNAAYAIRSSHNNSSSNMSIQPRSFTNANKVIVNNKVQTTQDIIAFDNARNIANKSANVTDGGSQIQSLVQVSRKLRHNENTGRRIDSEKASMVDANMGDYSNQGIDVLDESENRRRWNNHVSVENKIKGVRKLKNDYSDMKLPFMFRNFSVTQNIEQLRLLDEQFDILQKDQAEEVKRGDQFKTNRVAKLDIKQSAGMSLMVKIKSESALNQPVQKRSQAIRQNSDDPELIMQPDFGMPKESQDPFVLVVAQSNVKLINAKRRGKKKVMKGQKITANRDKKPENGVVIKLTNPERIKSKGKIQQSKTPLDKSISKSPQPVNQPKPRKPKRDNSDEKESQSFGTYQESSDNQKSNQNSMGEIESKNLPNPIQNPLDRAKIRSVGYIKHQRGGGYSKMGRGQRGLAQKAYEIAEKTKNNVINYWNLFVVDNGKPYTDSYKVIKKIGQGGAAEVFMVMHLPTDKIRAMKVVSKQSYMIVKTIYDELNVLKSLDHPNIVKIFEYFQDDKNLYIIMEYLQGGSVYDRMKILGFFGERDSAYIMKQILQALNYCSEKGVVHRDLKIENILFSHEEQLQIKIVDFGSSVFLDQYNAKTTNRIITSYYVAPEVVNKEENIAKCDVWSIGVILFILLSGALPFKGNSDQEVLEKVCKGQFNFDDKQWKNVSSKPKFLIKDMIDVNVKTRFTLVQCIDSSWIKMLTKIDDQFRIDAKRISKALSQLNAFQPVCKFRILVLHFCIIYFQFESQIEKLSKVFSYFDLRHISSICDKDLYKYARRLNPEVDHHLLKFQQTQLVQKLDLRKENGIAYSDFLIACLDFTSLLTSQKLVKLFNIIDKDGDGFISIKDLHLFTTLQLQNDQCHQLLKECMQQLDVEPAQQPQDIPYEQLKLSFPQFKKIILNVGLAQPKRHDSTIKVTHTQPLLQFGSFKSPKNSGLQEKQMHPYFVAREGSGNIRENILYDNFSPNGSRRLQNKFSQDISQNNGIARVTSNLQPKNQLILRPGGVGPAPTTDESKEEFIDPNGEKKLPKNVSGIADQHEEQKVQKQKKSRQRGASQNKIMVANSLHKALDQK